MVTGDALGDQQENILLLIEIEINVTILIAHIKNGLRSDYPAKDWVLNYMWT